MAVLRFTQNVPVKLYCFAFAYAKFPTHTATARSFTVKWSAGAGGPVNSTVFSGTNLAYDGGVAASGLITSVREVQRSGSATVTGVRISVAELVKVAKTATKVDDMALLAKILAGNDLVTFGRRNDVFDGAAGNDTIRGNGGNDVLKGGRGNDKLYGGVGNDRLDGGVGNDVIYGDAGNDTIDGGAGNDRLYGGDGVDVIFAGAGNDTVHGGNGNDWLYGGSGTNYLYGEAGDDFIAGGDNVDFIYGGTGNDRIFAGGGNDIVHGGLGADYLDAGPGADIYLYTSLADSTVAPSGRDLIDEFQPSQGDKIDLRPLDANSLTAGDDAFIFIGALAFSGTPGELRIEIEAGKSIVMGDVNGDGVADFAIAVSQGGLQATDFFL
ncbi:MAG: hypothetical protein KF723_05245 [Rhizobiaceae bacterium]|nr:hypothetical protein [Rhizobiaceae bacterium]